MLTM
ncbi:Protein of unknown function [Bacillus toyonensis]|jgi:hypothetical protein